MDSECDFSSRGLTSVPSVSAVHFLNLANNRLSSLPPAWDLHAARIDLSNNPWSSEQAILQGLVSVDGLQTVTIDGIPESWLEAIRAALPTVLVNGRSSSTRGSVSSAASSHQHQHQHQHHHHHHNEQTRRQEIVLQTTVRQEDLDAATRAFNVLKGLKGEAAGPDAERSLQNKFDAHFKDTMADFHALASDETDPYVRHGYALKAKHRLYDIVFADAIDTAMSIYPELGHVLQTLRSAVNETVADIPMLLRDMSQRFSNDLTSLKAAVVRSDRETTELLEAAELLEQETHVHIEEKKAMQSEFEKERAALIAELQRQEAIISKLSRGQGTYVGGAGSSTSFSAVNRSGSPTRRPPSAKSPRVASPTRGNASASQPRGTNAPVVRSLTKHQLLETIEEIYESKTKFDAKCTAAHLPKETMEQHLYTYLNTKYGLKNLVIEWAAAIITATRAFSSEDNDVDVFGAIMRNEIDEEFRFVQKQLKETVQELLKGFLKGKYPLKTEGEINELLRKKMAGNVQEDEWTDIVKYMYNRDDSIILITKIKDVIRSNQLKAPAPSPFRLRQPRSLEQKSLSNQIPYDQFLRQLLTFQLDGHQKFLLHFNVLFREVDTDRNGIIDEDQARKLISCMATGLSERSILEKLNVLDPFNNKQITYSEAVSGLSQELVKMMKG